LDLSFDYNRTWLLPTVVFDTPAGRQRFNIGTDNSVTGNLILRQALYSGGRIRASRAAARHFSRSAAAAEVSIRQQIQALAEGSFFAVVLAAEFDEVSALALGRARANETQVAAMHRAGRALEYDLVRARVQIHSLASDSIEVRNRLAMARSEFRRLIGVEPNRELDLTGGFDRPTAIPLNDLEALVGLALQRRPEIQQMNELIRARRLDVDVEKAGIRPELFMVANGQMQLQSDELDFAGEEWRKSWNTGVSLDIPVFDGMLARSKIKGARLEYRKAELEKERVVKNIGLEVRQAWLDFRASESRRASQVGVLELAQRGLSLAQSRYVAGAGTQLEVLDAQLMLRQSETDLATAEHDRAVALVRLEQAAGFLAAPSSKP
jgi:outer membrane protein TolC